MRESKNTIAPNLPVALDRIVKISESASCEEDFESFESSVFEVCEEITKLFSEDKISESYLLLCSLEKSKNYHEENGMDLENVFLTLSSYEDSFNKVKESYNKMKELLVNLCGDDGWELVKKSSGVETFWKQEPGQPTVSIKLLGVIDAPVANLIAIIYENDLWCQWFGERLKESTTVTTPSKFSKTVYVKSASMGPVCARDCYMIGTGYDLLKEQAICILCRDANASELEMEEGILFSFKKKKKNMGHP